MRIRNYIEIFLLFFILVLMEVNFKRTQIFHDALAVQFQNFQYTQIQNEEERKKRVLIMESRVTELNSLIDKLYQRQEGILGREQINDTKVKSLETQRAKEH